jgi:hypothetical protein
VDIVEVTRTCTIEVTSKIMSPSERAGECRDRHHGIDGEGNDDGLVMEGSSARGGMPDEAHGGVARRRI